MEMLHFASHWKITITHSKKRKPYTDQKWNTITILFLSKQMQQIWMMQMYEWSFFMDKCNMIQLLTRNKKHKMKCIQQKSEKKPIKGQTHWASTYLQFPLINCATTSLILLSSTSSSFHHAHRLIHHTKQNNRKQNSPNKSWSLDQDIQQAFTATGLVKGPLPIVDLGLIQYIHLLPWNLRVLSLSSCCPIYFSLWCPAFSCSTVSRSLCTNDKFACIFFIILFNLYHFPKLEGDYPYDD